MQTSETNAMARSVPTFEALLFIVEMGLYFFQRRNLKMEEEIKMVDLQTWPKSDCGHVKCKERAGMQGETWKHFNK